MINFNEVKNGETLYQVTTYDTSIVGRINVYYAKPVKCTKKLRSIVQPSDLFKSREKADKECVRRNKELCTKKGDR